MAELGIPCRFCGDSGSYATNEIRSWGSLFGASSLVLKLSPVRRGFFFASFLTWTETNLAAARRRVDPGRDNPGSTRDAGPTLAPGLRIYGRQVPGRGAATGSQLVALGMGNLPQRKANGHSTAGLAIIRPKS